MYYLGFDIGGSSIKAALVKDKKITKSIVYDLPNNLDEMLDLIANKRDELIDGIAQAEIGGFGFGFAGQLDIGREKMLNSPNI